MNVRFVSVTDVGKLRNHNEDTVGDPEICREYVPTDGVAKRGLLFAVADGMGGHEGGEVASAIAVETLFRRYYSGSNHLREALIGAFREANEAVFTAANERLVQRSPGLAASPDPALLMGTTLVAAIVFDHRALVANVGDSRAYVLHQGTLRRITEDHSLVAEYVRARVLTEAEAARATYRNILLRALGQAAETVPDVFDVALAEDDILLLSSDGLHGVVKETEIQRVLMTNDIADAAQELVRRANELGGPDNISVVIAQSRPSERIANQRFVAR